MLIIAEEAFKLFKLSMSEDVHLLQLKGGITNTTYRVDISQHPRFVLQKVNRAFHEQQTNDIAIISQHLTEKGWNVPLPYEIGGKTSFLYKGERYRMYNYINGREVLEIKSEEQAYHLGRVLASFHYDLQDCKYRPQNSIPNFHNTSAIMKKLSALAVDKDMLAGKILEQWEEIKKHMVLSNAVSLIHADARYQNFLFDSESYPFTLIDFDTFMVGSIYVDIGDLMRSISYDFNQEIANVNKKFIVLLLDGYQSTTKTAPSFIQQAMIAMLQMSIELAARFIIDTYEDIYFAWDRERFQSRKVHNTVRAQAQIEGIQQMKGIMK